MYSVAFIIAPGNFDEEFSGLNKLIQEAAESMEGYVGKETWLSTDRSKINTIYYWKTEEALKEFSSHPKHLEAKQQYSKWYAGYHVVVSHVQHSYGDSKFEHITPNERSTDDT